MIFGHSFSQMPIAGQPPRAKNGSVSSPNIVEASPSSDRWTPRPDGGGEGGGFTSTQLDSGISGTQAPGLDRPEGVLCDPNDTFAQTTFLGASILDFSVTLGYGEQSSSITVKLVEDLCEGHSRIYYHGHKDLKVGNFSSLQPVTTTRADNFFPPFPGSPVYFRMGRFEFSGLLQSWTKSFTTSGYPTYTVNVQDPRELLAGVNLIIGEDVTTPAISNIFNVFGVMEQFGGACAVSPVGGFGGANVNSEGMPWNNILTGLHYLQATGKYITFKDAQYLLDLTDLPVAGDNFRISGAVVTLADAISKLCEDSGCDFFVDLIPTPVSSAFGSRVINILKIRSIDRTLQPDTDAIKIFVENTTNLVMESSRGRELRNEITNAMILGASKEDIYECECPMTIGQEKDGGAATDWLSGIIPFWGTKRPDSHELILTRKKDPAHPAVPPQKILGIWAPFAALNETLEDPVLEDGNRLRRDPVDRATLVYDLDEDEMRAALAGQQDWVMWVTSQVDHPVNITYYPDPANPGKGKVGGTTADLRKYADLFNRLLAPAGPAIQPAHIRDLNKNFAAFAAEKTATGQKQRDMNKIYSWVSSYARRYGRAWAVALYGNLCWKVDTDDPYKKKFSVTPVDKGWPETTGAQVVGLDIPTARVMFGDESGRVGSCMRFRLKDDKCDFGIAFAGGFNAGNKLVFSSLNPDDYYITPDETWAWVKSGVNQEIHFLREQRLDTDYGPHAVVTLPGSVKVIKDPLVGGGGHNAAVVAMARVFNALLNPAADPAKDAKIKDLFKKILNKKGSRTLNFGMQDSTMNPVAGAVPLKNNILNYGPWQSSPAGADGKTSVEVVEGLAPWEYGGLDLMNTAGQELANAKVTHMQHGEMGSIKVPGLPNNVRVGFELNDIGGSKALIATDRSVNTAAIIGEGTLEDSEQTYYYVAAGSLTGTGGPNITAINVTVGAGGVTTQYDFKTYTPQYGKFSKGNAERLKSMGKARINAERQRITTGSIALSRRSAAMGAALIAGAGVINRNNPPPPRRPSASPHEFLVGEIDNWESPSLEDLRHSSVATEGLDDTGTELDDNYGNKAIMEWAGLVRPVSMAGDGNLPQYYSSQNLVDKPPCANSQHISSRPMPPINGYTAPEGVAAGDFDININYLNPFTNPQGKSKSAKHVEEDNSEHGHDIGFIARGQEVTEGHFSIAMQEHDESDTSVADGYTDDYRMFALRGPLLIHGWGYDLEGKPIPNAADSESNAAEGEFEETGLKDYFLPNFLRKSHTWPVAPVDLRFDRTRGVWTVPPPPRFLLLNLEQGLVSGETTERAKIADSSNPAVYGKDGSAIPLASYVKFKDDIGITYLPGDKVRAYYDDIECVYKSFSTDSTSGSSDDGCDGLFIGTMAAFMDADENGTATLDEKPDAGEINVVNTLKQPILKDCKVILWKKCKTGCTSLTDCPEGAEDCVDGVCVDEDGNPMETPGTATYHVVQAQFRPLCVVTSIGIDEQYPPNPPPAFAAAFVGASVSVATKVYVDQYCDSDANVLISCDGAGGMPSNYCGECTVSVDDLQECGLGGDRYITTNVPAGAFGTCYESSIGEEDYHDEHRHSIGSFSLTAVSAAEVDASAAAIVQFPTYPVLHINICERKIYLQTAWSEALCSDEREQVVESPLIGNNVWGLNVPVYGDVQSGDLVGEIEETSCYTAEAGLVDGGCPDPAEYGTWPDTDCSCVAASESEEEEEEEEAEEE